MEATIVKDREYYKQRAMSENKKIWDRWLKEIEYEESVVRTEKAKNPKK